MSDDDNTEYGDLTFGDAGSSREDSDQLQASDTLDDRGVDDVLDEGYSPPDHEPSHHGDTPRERWEGETLDRRLAEEEPDVATSAGEPDPDYPEFDPDQPGARRAGRLVAPDQGGYDDNESDAVAGDVGIDGAGASAEEAAVHIIDPD